MATALLVAGPTLTLWIPGQTLFASTSSYSSLDQSLPVQWLFPINAHYLSGYTVAHRIHSGWDTLASSLGRSIARIDVRID